MRTKGKHGDWTERHGPAANTQAIASKAASTAGLRHVCTALSFTITNDGAAKTGVVTVNLRDGATGAGTIKKSWRFIVPAGDTRGLGLSDLNIPGTANTAMTLETSAAPGASVTADMNLEGITRL